MNSAGVYTDLFRIVSVDKIGSDESDLCNGVTLKDGGMTRLSMLNHFSGTGHISPLVPMHIWIRV